jgi:hypothetical protein
MSHAHNPQVSITRDWSSAFLFVLYLGFLLLLILVWFFDKNPNSKLRLATNIYGLQALAGALLGFWRIRKYADNPKTTPALTSVWICLGLTTWTIGQLLWIIRGAAEGNPYVWWSDAFYIASDVCWLVALLRIFQSLGRRSLTEISRFTAIMLAALSLVTACFGWVESAQIKDGLSKAPLLLVVCDFAYVLVTFSTMILAIALMVGENAEIPRPVSQALKYLCAATTLDAAANLAFVVTQPEKLTAGSALAYSDGNWVDWLFLTAMCLWGVSALKWPIRQADLYYTFGTKRSGAKLEDLNRASEIAGEYSQPARMTDPDSINWILDNIPGCLRVVKLGDQVVGSTLVFPVSRTLMQTFIADKITENELFEEVKTNSLIWDCLYLADVSILTAHRRRRLAFNCFRTTIENIAKEHGKPALEVYCWPTNLERKRLFEKLELHFEKQGIRVIKKE